MSIFEGTDAGKGYAATESDDVGSHFPWSEKAVKDGAYLMGEVLIDGDGVFERLFPRSIARVDDDIFSKFRSELEMLAEEITLAGVIGFLIPAIGRGVEIVEPSFSDGDTAWVLSHLP